jgi:hypothetical protein
MVKVKDGDRVDWNGTKGTVEKVEPKTVSKTIKGHKITKDGTKDDPVVTMKTDSGVQVLHKTSELKKA